MIIFNLAIDLGYMAQEARNAYLQIPDGEYEAVMTAWEFIDWQYGERLRGDFILLSGDYVGSKLVKHWSSVWMEGDQVHVNPRSHLAEDYAETLDEPITGTVHMDRLIDLPVVITTRTVNRNATHRQRGKRSKYSVVDRLIGITIPSNAVV